jgi:hypothetical protein
MPDQNIIILHGYDSPAHFIVLDAKTGSFKVSFRYQNSISNHPDGRFMVAKYQNTNLYTVYASVDYVAPGSIF